MTLAAVARIAACGLDCTPQDPVRVDADAWPALRRRIAEERLAALALVAAERGLLDLPSGAADDLRALRRAAHSADVLLERLVVAATAVLARAGISSWVLKGPALAHQVYAQPGLRSFGDVDLLIRAQDVDRGLVLLAEAFGATRRFAQPRPGFDRRFAKGVCLDTAAGFEIDVHRTLAPGPFGLRVDIDAVLDHSATVRIADHEVAVLGLEAALLHAALHAALGDVAPRIATLRDIAELASSPALDPVRFAALVDTCGARAPVARAGALTREVVGLGPEQLPGLAALGGADRAPSRRDRTLLAAYGGRRGRYPRQCAATFWDLSGRRRLAYAQALLLPSRAYLRERDRSYTSRLARAAALAGDRTLEPTDRRPDATCGSTTNQEAAWTAR